MSTQHTKTYWEKFVEGDKSMFQKVFKKYYKRLFSYGLKLVHDNQMVEDCIQELFENIWKRRSKLSHIESPDIYLLISLRRRLFAQKKKLKNREERGIKFKKNMPIEFSKEEIIIKNEAIKEQKEELVEALNKLSDRQKEIIYLHFYNGYSYEEIKEILSINRQSVRNHVYRAMKVLRSFLSDQNGHLLFVTFLICIYLHFFL